MCPKTGAYFFLTKKGANMLKIYTTSTCNPCKMVKQFLDSKGAKYETIVLDEQPEKVDELMALTGQMSVPVTTDGKSVVVGWSPSKLVALLGGAA